ncbi:MAG: zeta toxin family protein [Bacteroidales bacterium]|nr:zeta toxin family protein [Bacteroidales bacterium]
MNKTLYIISGCNGAGKTTASYTILPEILDCKEFINADEIAKGLSPFQPEKVAIEAGKIMLGRIKELLKENITFAFETTLSTKTHKNIILQAKKQGYIVVLLFFWLQNIELAKARVRQRVAEGGHNIEASIIERRYIRGIVNLFDIYLPVADEIFIFDNSNNTNLVAQKTTGTIKIVDNNKYNQIKQYYEDSKK